MTFAQEVGGGLQGAGLPADRRLDPDQLQISFMLGAGASKPDPSNIPTVKELLPQLLERARRLDREDVTKLADFCNDRSIDNIEDLLTAAQLATFCSRNPTVLRLLNFLLYRRDIETHDEDWVNYMEPKRRRAEPTADVSSVAFLQDTLQVLFGLLASTMLPAKSNKAHESIAAYCSQHPETLIVTTNYDCCMDLALEDINQPFQYRVEFAKRQELYTKEDRPAARLIKLHGSLNWYYCETCQEVQLVDIRGMLQRYVDPDTNVVTRIKRKLSASIPNFDENRIIRMSGNCAEMLPKFLSGHLKRGPEQRERREVQTKRVKKRVRAKVETEQRAPADS